MLPGEDSNAGKNGWKEKKKANKSKGDLVTVAMNLQLGYLMKEWIRVFDYHLKKLFVAWDS